MLIVYYLNYWNKILNSKDNLTIQIGSKQKYYYN